MDLYVFPLLPVSSLFFARDLSLSLSLSSKKKLDSASFVSSFFPRVYHSVPSRLNLSLCYQQIDGQKQIVFPDVIAVALFYCRQQLS